MVQDEAGEIGKEIGEHAGSGVEFILRAAEAIGCEVKSY